MPLELKPGSNQWTGRVQVNGQRHFLKLGIVIEGQRPKTLRENGDSVFEISRAFAQAKLDQLETELREKGDPIRFLRRMHTITTGSEITSIPLSELYAKYAGLLRRRPLSERYAVQLESLADEFAEFCQKLTPTVRVMSMVTDAVVEKFAKHELSRGATNKTFNNRIGALKTMFAALAEKAGLYANPFEKVPLLEASDDEVLRRPFSLDEIKTILDELKGEHFVRPIFLLALCTAMRRCDCCLLRFEHIDWTSKVILVTPAKRGARVRIPIFPALENELDVAMRKQPRAKPGDYVFPEQAKMFLKNPDGITWRVKTILTRCGFHMFDEDAAGSPKALSVAREQGLRRASVLGIHSCRTTWITLALLGGIPHELVRKVTGQKSVEIVLKHYFRPQDQQLRETLGAKLPLLLTGAKPAEKIDVKDQVAALLTAMTSENWETMRSEAIRLLKSA